MLSDRKFNEMQATSPYLNQPLRSMAEAQVDAKEKADKIVAYRTQQTGLNPQVIKKFVK